MPPYASYRAADFALDDSFQMWVIRPDAALDAFWNAFLEKHPWQRPAVLEARRLVLALRADWQEITPEQTEESFRSFEAKLDGLVRAEPRVRLLPVGWYRVAAAVALLITALAAGWYLFPLSTGTVYRTAYGEIRTLTLPDGSVVILNANSTLTLPASWNDTLPREVWLAGEAYFKITRKPLRPNGRFLVHTSDLKVEVLGTQFNVRNRGRQTQVVLREGKVKVDPAGRKGPEPVYLQPGESVTFAPASPRLIRENVNPARFEAWRHQKLMLDNTPVSEVARIIEETYGLEVQFEDPAVADILLNGTSLSTDNLDKLINTLQPTLSVSIVREKDRIIFKK
jgi:ferric-dicitrate binding protein FerR (iron transport regulator)